MLDSISDILMSILDFILDLIFIVFDAVFSLIFNFFDLLIENIPFLNISSLVSQLPEQLIEMLAVLHINECMSLIVSALFIRFMMQLIPFVRLGS